MSQSRFSIVLVGVSALLRRPLVSRLRPADGERSPWVAFAARGGRFDSGGRSVGWPSGFCFGDCRSASWPSGSPLPLFGMHRFGVAAGRVGSSAFRFGNCPRRVDSSAGRVGLRAHGFRFSVCAASEWPLGEFVLPPSAPEIAARRAALRVHRFRFSARIASEWLLGEFVLPPSASEIALGGLAFGLTAFAFRHAPLRRFRSADWFFRLPFRRLPFGGLALSPSVSELPLGGWPSDSPLPLFGTHRFGVAAGRVGLRVHCFRFSACTDSEIALGGLVLPLGGLAFGLTASAFRYAPIRTAAPPKRGPTEHNDTTTVSLQNTYSNMLTYHIVRRKHFKTGKLLYYPQLVTPVADDHMHIIERIEKKCTLASADVKAVVDALEVEIIDSLRQGRSVRLGDLGSFRPTLRCSAGVGLPELAGVGQIKRVHVVFHPSSRIRRALSVKDHAVSFVQRDKKKHGANVQQGGSPTGGGTPGAPAPSTGTSAAGSAVTPPGTPVPAAPSTGTPAGTPVPAAPSTTTSTPTGTPTAGSGTSAAGSTVTPPGTPVPAPPSTGAPSGTPVPAAPSTGTPAVSGTPAAGGA